MNREIQYGIIEHLKTELAVNDVLWFRDDLSIDGREKPFVVVEDMQAEFEIIAAGRADFEEVYRYQIAVRADSEDELNILRAEVIRALRKPIALYSLTSLTVAGYFYVDAETAAPIRSDETTREVDKYRAYIDASVTEYVHEN